MSEREKLGKGIKQLYQEMLITNSIDHDKYDIVTKNPFRFC